MTGEERLSSLEQRPHEKAHFVLVDTKSRSCRFRGRYPKSNIWGHIEAVLVLDVIGWGGGGGEAIEEEQISGSH